MKKEVFRTSSRYREQKCPGSHSACRDISSPSSAAAASGVRIHTAMEIGTAHDMLKQAFDSENPNEILQLHGSVAAERMNLNTFDAGFVRKGMEEIAGILIEAKNEGQELIWSQREPSLYQDCGTYAFAGHADLVIGLTNRVSILDHKTGANDVVQTDNNPQLQGYAPFYQDMNKPVRIHIMARGNDPFHSYTTIPAEMLPVIRAQMDAEAAACMAPDAPRKVGEWCQYCNAKCTDRCPESVTSMDTFVKTSIEARDISAVLQWPPQIKAAWLSRWKQVKPMFEQAYETLKSDAEAGNVVGWEVKTTMQRSVADMAGLVQALMNDGMSAIDIVSASKIGMTDLEAVYWQHAKAMATVTGVKCDKKDVVIKRLNETIAPYIERSERKTLKEV